MILTVLKVELPLLVARRCPSGRFIVNILVLEIATAPHRVGDGADLFHLAAASVAFGDVDLEDLGQHLGPSVVASRLGVAVVIVVSELDSPRGNNEDQVIRYSRRCQMTGGLRQ